MPENGDLAGLLGGMVRGRLEQMAAERVEQMAAGRVEQMAAGRVEQYAGREAFGQLTPQQMQLMPEYFKSGAPYGRTREGMMRWIDERAAASQPEVATPPVQVAQPAVSNVVGGTRIRSFAEHEQIRSFAEHEQIRGFGEHL